MDPGFVLVFLAGCGLFLVCLGGLSLFSVPNKQKQIEETDGILKKRVFENEDKVRGELDDYFIKIVIHLTKAEVCFFFAFVILSLTVDLTFGLSIFKAMTVTGIPALTAALVGRAVKKEVKQLRIDCLDRLSESRSS